MNKIKASFDLEMQYDENIAPVSETGKIGHYIGSGEGSIKGALFEGKIHFTLYESQGKGLCESNLFGVISTNGGAKINFDSMGIFKVPNPEKSHEWVTTAAVNFDTEDERFDWLNTALGTWNGSFDMKSYLHQYKLEIH